jgi:hypothetical protein
MTVEAKSNTPIRQRKWRIGVGRQAAFASVTIAIPPYSNQYRER